MAASRVLATQATAETVLHVPLSMNVQTMFTTVRQTHHARIQLVALCVYATMVGMATVLRVSMSTSVLAKMINITTVMQPLSAQTLSVALRVPVLLVTVAMV
jgi:hypothetical protein